MGIFGKIFGRASPLEQIKLAAAQGDAGAQCSMGIMYDQGQFFAQDYAEALKWYKLAAAQGDTMAQFCVGDKYRDRNVSMTLRHE
jgi:hypothetical protein